MIVQTAINTDLFATKKYNKILRVSFKFITSLHLIRQIISRMRALFRFQYKKEDFKRDYSIFLYDCAL